MSRLSDGEKALAEALEAEPLPGWDLQTEYRFDDVRRWRFDFAFPSVKLAIEVEGKAHYHAKRHKTDCEKLNEALRQGWRVLRFPNSERKKAAEWAALIREVLCFSEATNR
jgi:very-short-patch-repair endonuclease